MGASNKNEDRTWNLVQWGQGACSLHWAEVQSPLWVQLLFLIVDYKILSDLIFLKTQAVLITYPLNVMDYTDIIQISLCLPQAIPFGASLGNS